MRYFEVRGQTWDTATYTYARLSEIRSGQLKKKRKGTYKYKSDNHRLEIEMEQVQAYMWLDQLSNTACNKAAGKYGQARVQPRKAGQQ